MLSHSTCLARVACRVSIFVLILIVNVTATEFIKTSIYYRKEYNIKLDKNDKLEYSNGSYNPDMELSTPEMIRRAGYPAEAHTVETEDGYLLTIHRIPNKTGYPIFLQHGLMSSSADWVISGRGQALPYLLADLGYDVWLGNYRGNTYSPGHVRLSTSGSEYWDYSWHEMGIHDLPAMINYVTSYKDEQVIYIGHSMGTTGSFVMAAERPDMHKKIRLIISFAPVAHMTHMKSPIRIFAPYAREVELIEKFFSLNKFLPRDWITKLIGKYGCALTTKEEKVCENVMFAISGFDAAQFNLSLLPVITNHDPAGASTKTVVHYLQEVTSGRFRQYDYGTTKNIEKYNASSPPDYDVSKMTIPVAFFYGLNDWLAAAQDVEEFYKKLPNAIGIVRINYTMFNHLDFLWATEAPQLLYNQVLDLIHDTLRG
ncbi:lipase 3 [Diachasma alloeum]|uniref:lipase 3 n=1 Tax=Diachasma alloeum TaxID=454923 RepID=UPI0007384297|nr:lipase 3 [Diachasma alloeum]